MKKSVELPVDLYLLCAPDIPWKADNVRENSGESRELLFNRYKEEITALNTPLKIISGNGAGGTRMALDAVKET